MKKISITDKQRNIYTHFFFYIGRKSKINRRLTHFLIVSIQGFYSSLCNCKKYRKMYFANDIYELKFF